jgi:hypothetical protein
MDDFGGMDDFGTPDDLEGTDGPGSADDADFAGAAGGPDDPIREDLEEIEAALDRIASAYDDLEFAETLSTSDDADISAAGQQIGQALARLDDVRERLLHKQRDLTRALQEDTPDRGQRMDPRDTGM